jgi:hypothetical protein
MKKLLIVLILLTGLNASTSAQRLPAIGMPIGTGAGGDTTWTTLNISDKSANITLPTNLSWSAGSGSGGVGICRSTHGFSSGKIYAEVTITLGTDNVAKVGIAKATDLTSGAIGSQAAAYGYRGQPICIMGPSNAANGTGLCTGKAPVTTSIVSLILDMDNHTFTAWFNGLPTATTITGLSGTYYFAVGGGGTACSGTINFGQTGFFYTPPSGFTGAYKITP